MKRSELIQGTDYALVRNRRTGPRRLDGPGGYWNFRATYNGPVPRGNLLFTIVEDGTATSAEFDARNVICTWAEHEQAERDIAAAKSAAVKRMKDEVAARIEARDYLAANVPADAIPWWAAADQTAKVHNDGSGVYGLDYGTRGWGITTVDLANIVKAALAKAQE